MEFELKSAKTVGGIISNSDNTMTQQVNVTVRVKGCPYEDIKTEKTIQYTFPNTMSAIDIEKGIKPFCNNWVTENYPNT